MHIVEMIDPSTRNLAPLGAEFDVGAHEVKTRSDTLHTSGVFTCIAIAAYNPRTRRGMLGRFSAITPVAAKQGSFSDNKDFKTAVNNIQWLGDPASTRIWLGGGAPSYNIYGYDQVETDREYAETRVRRFTDRNDLTQPRVTTHWVGEHQGLSMTLNCNLGILAIENLSAPAPELH